MTVTIEGDNVAESNQIEVNQIAGDEDSVLTCKPSSPCLTVNEFDYDYSYFSGGGSSIGTSTTEQTPINGEERALVNALKRLILKFQDPKIKSAIKNGGEDAKLLDRLSSIITILGRYVQDGKLLVPMTASRRMLWLQTLRGVEDTVQKLQY